MQSQDEKIFESIYEDHADNVYALARFKGLSESDAADVVQDTFMAVFASYHSFEGRSSLKTYVVSIARHKIADHYRKASRRQEEALSETLAMPDSDQSEERVDVMRATQRLKDDDQDLLHLIFTQGLNYKEAATILDIPEGTVKSRMHKIRTQMKKHLGGGYP